MPEVHRADLLKWDYERTQATVQTLTDVRFKLLALVPTITGFGIASAFEKNASAMLPLGIVGFVATLGATLYDVRNSKLHNFAMHRLKMLERQLHLPLLTAGMEYGGHMNERPPPSVRFFGILAKHDPALACVYAAALAAWAYVALRGAPLIWHPGWLIALAAVIIGVAAVLSLLVIDNDKATKPQPAVGAT